MHVRPLLVPEGAGGGGGGIKAGGGRAHIKGSGPAVFWHKMPRSLGNLTRPL